MNEFRILLALVTGLALGIFFFGGLWYTVRKVLDLKNPALWVLGSFFIRTGITLLGFYYISLGAWYHVVLCLIGFMAGRYAVIRRTKTRQVSELELNRKS